MALAILRNDNRTAAWISALAALAPDIPLYDYHQPHPRAAIRMVGVWKHPRGSLGEYPNLLGVHGLGAGVDFILEDPALPEGIPVLRVVDPYLASDMAEYVLAQILSHLRQLPAYTRDQSSGTWNPRPYRRIEDIRVGIMGLGTLGKAVADLLVRAGFDVRGWTARSQPDTGYPVFQGPEGRKAFLSESDILVCLLPLTPETRGILDQQVFGQLPAGAALINVARGGLLHEEDLLQALGTGHIAHACLDVFSQEPLPKGHSFWKHPKISMTSHVASVSEPESVAVQVVANYRALLAGDPLTNEVSRERGY